MFVNMLYVITMCAHQERLKFLTPPTPWSHRDAIARNDEGDTTVGNLLVSFIISLCGEKCQMTSMITRSKNEVNTMVQQWRIQDLTLGGVDFVNRGGGQLSESVVG